MQTGFEDCSRNPQRTLTKIRNILVCAYMSSAKLHRSKFKINRKFQKAPIYFHSNSILSGIRTEYISGLSTSSSGHIHEEAYLTAKSLLTTLYTLYQIGCKTFFKLKASKRGILSTSSSKRISSKRII